MNKNHRIASFLPESWNPPHVDAALFVSDVIGEASGMINRSNRSEEEIPLDVIGKLSDLELYEMDDQARKDAHDRTFYDKALPFDDYEGRDVEEELLDIPFSDIVEDRDLLARALAALERGDPEDIVNSLSELSERHPEDEFKLAGIEEIENWSNILASTKASEASQGGISGVKQQVIRAINDLATRLCELIAKDERALQFVEWRDLERVVAAALAGLGFDVELTQPSKDQGRDVVALCQVNGHQLHYEIEIKHWRSGKRVGESEIYHFIEVNANDRTDGGLFLSTSGYTNTVVSQVCELTKRRIRLGGSEKVVTLCQHFWRRQRGLWEPLGALPEVLFERTLG